MDSTSDEDYRSEINTFFGVFELNFPGERTPRFQVNGFRVTAGFDAVRGFIENLRRTPGGVAKKLKDSVVFALGNSSRAP